MKMQLLRSAAYYSFSAVRTTVSTAWTASVHTVGTIATMGIATALGASVSIPLYMAAQPMMFTFYTVLVISTPFVTPIVNYRLAEYALNNGYTGLADFALSLQQLASHIPLIHNLFPSRDYTRLLNDGMLHNAMEKGNLAMAKLIIRNGADINVSNSKYDSPLAIALQSKLPGADELSLLLINRGSDLAFAPRKSAIASFQLLVRSDDNVFHLILKSGKMALIQATLAKLNPTIPADLAVLRSKDEHGNNIEHIAAANPNIKAELDQLKGRYFGDRFSVESLNATNENQHTPLDIAIISHKQILLSANDVLDYIRQGAVTCDVNKVKYLIQNEELRQVGVAKLLFESNHDYLRSADGFGKHVLEYAITIGDDALASSIARITPDAITEHRLLGLAYRHQLPATCAILLEKYRGDAPAFTNFLRNPEGDGNTALHKFASGEWPFNREDFAMCYKAEKEFFKDGIEYNPLMQLNPIGLNVFYNSLFCGKLQDDFRAPKAILEICQTEGIKKSSFATLIGQINDECIELLAPVARELHNLPLLKGHVTKLINRAIEDEVELSPRIAQQLKLLQAPIASSMQLQP